MVSFNDFNNWWKKSDEWVYDKLPDWWKSSDKTAQDAVRRVAGGPYNGSGKSWWEPGYDAGPRGPQGPNPYGPQGPMGPDGTGGASPAGEEDAYAAALAAYERMRNGGSEEDSGSGSSGYNIQAMVNQINDSFNRQRQGLDESKALGSTNIQNAYNQFASNIGRNYADYTGATEQSQSAMAQRVAQQIADAQGRQAELQKSSQSVGQDIGALTQQQSGNLASLQSAASFQQDLSQRLAQIVADNQRSLQGSGELVRQGATGNLENNYQALLGALMSNREQNIMSAQSAGSGGGGGGSSKSSKGTSAKDVYDELSYSDKAIKMLLGEQDTGGDFAGVSRDKLFDFYQANINSEDESLRTAALSVVPYLATPLK